VKKMVSVISEEEREKLIRNVKKEMESINIGENPAFFKYYNFLAELLSIYKKEEITKEDLEKIKQLFEKHKSLLEFIRKEKGFKEIFG